MNKIVKVIFVVIITILIMSNVCAALSCDFTVQPSKKEVKQKEEVTVDFKVSDIQSEKGIITFGATLEYDKECFELVKMEGKNGWETPIEGASYNSSNGKIVITRNGLGKNDETVFSATFRAKETGAETSTINLKEVAVADGTTLAKTNNISQDIKISKEVAKSNQQNSNGNATNVGDKTSTDIEKNEEQNNVSLEEENNNTNTNTNTNTTENTVTNNTSQGVNNTTSAKTKKKMPIIFIIIIILIILIIIIILVKRKKDRDY